MSQQLTLELSDEVYNTLQHQADAIGLSVTDWIITKLGNSDRVEEPSNKAQPEQARQRFKSHAGSISLGYATGINNESVDNDMISPLDQDSPENQNWEVFALNNLNKCYSEDEPIYDVTHIKEYNSDYERR
jgi:hypothetical protein